MNQDTPRPGSARPPRGVSRVASALIAALAVSVCARGGLRAANKESQQVPWTVRVDVHWGEKKNREAYRSGIERALIAIMVEKTCFEKVVSEGPAELVLDVQLNDFKTEQEYESSESLFPGQGEEHRLRAARVSVNLDYWLHPEGRDTVEILQGHVFRQLQRESDVPGDSAEERVLRDLTADASRWVARDVCDRRRRLRSKIDDAMGSSASRPN